MAVPHTSRTTSVSAFFLDMWYHKRWYAWLLLPLSWVYQLFAALHQYHQKYRQKQHGAHISVPIVVVGNITTGGTGKTPVLIALAKALIQQGLRIGVISRGYGSHAPYYPYPVSVDDSPYTTGDEPLLIARETCCPVVIASDRVAAAQQLIADHEVDLVLSDDGLQHRRLPRQLEIVVVDGQRGLGNHFCLPAGPLREPAKRLASVDWIVVNRAGMPPSNVEQKVTTKKNESQTGALTDVYLQATAWRHLATQQRYPLSPLPWLDGENTSASQIPAVRAIAGIGNPERFFNTLSQLGVTPTSCVAFADHHQYSPQDFAQWQHDIVLMTEKDAVKYQALLSCVAKQQASETTQSDAPHSLPHQGWSLLVDMHLPTALVDQVSRLANHKR